MRVDPSGVVLDADRRFKVSDEDRPKYETECVKRKAQLEDGFLGVADLLAECFCLAKFSEAESQVLWAVIRKTYGWHKKEDRISASQFRALTDLHPVKISAALNSLLARKILYRKHGKFGLIGINTSVDDWKLTKRKGNIENLTKTVKFSENLTKTVKKNLTKTVKHNIQGNTKEEEEAKASSLSSGDDEKRAGAKVNGTKREICPPCPNDEILVAWEKHCSFAPQPKVWGDNRKRLLSARWREGFKLTHRKTGRPLYTDRQSGVLWWNRFFEYIASNRRLQDAQWFSIDWMLKAANFQKIIDGHYEKEWQK